MCTCLQKLIPWEELGCNVPLVFYNALDALGALEQYKPDFVVSDLKMPGMDGKDLCRQIREHYPDVEVIFLSAYEDFPSMQIALQYGVRDYILKPISSESIEILEKSIKKIIEEKSNEKWWEQNFGQELSSRISRALDEQDTDFLDCLFEDMCMHKEDGLKQIQHYCVYLLHILVDYIRTDRVLKEYALLGVNDQKGLKKLLSLQEAEACIYFVQNNYNEVISLLPKKAEKKVLIDQINDLVEKNYMDPDFGVAWIASHVHLAPAYLSRVYAKNAGISLVEYIVTYRIEKACEQLQTTLLPIHQVSVSVGYRNVNYFAKLFRAQKGLSPSEYRKQYHTGIRDE